jgi:hypothetical protein
MSRPVRAVTREGTSAAAVYCGARARSAVGGGSDSSRIGV